MYRLVFGIVIAYIFVGLGVQAQAKAEPSLAKANYRQSMVSASSTKIEGFTKQCEYHIDMVAEGILAKTYVSAYIHTVLALDECVAYTEDEVEALNTIHMVRNKLMEEN